MSGRLLADSGSTKTDWVLEENGVMLWRKVTQGINPVLLPRERIREILVGELLPDFPAGRLEKVEFYGAGCRGAACDEVAAVLRELLPTDRIQVASDMLGAARMLCGTEAGMVGILGTGSNSCLYDGHDIVANVSPLGFILGDEGSGAVLGRRLLGDLYKGQLPEALVKDFSETYALELDEIIRRVYREPFPNRFLAGFCPFLYRHREDGAVRALLLEELERFFRRNLSHYGRPDLPVHFVGGIAYHFRRELEEAAAACGYTVGVVEKAPLDRHFGACRPAVAEG